MNISQRILYKVFGATIYNYETGLECTSDSDFRQAESDGYAIRGSVVYFGCVGEAHEVSFHDPEWSFVLLHKLKADHKFKSLYPNINNEWLITVLDPAGERHKECGPDLADVILEAAIVAYQVYT